MTEIIDKIKEWLNLGVLPLLGLMIFSSLFVFLPEIALDKLGLVEVKIKYSVYFGLGFVFSFSFLIATLIYRLWNIYIGHRLKDLTRLYFLKKDAKNLTADEKKILKYFIENQTRSASLSMKDGTVLGLENRKFIVRVGNLGTDAIRFAFPFNIQPWAWEFFNKNPGLLDEE